MDEPTPSEVVVDAFLDRLLRGEALDVESFLAAHPTLAPEDVGRLRKVARVLGRTPERRTRPDALPFERLGSYRLLERLGAGGMGVVYLALDERLDRRVALKVVRPELAGSPEAAARFEREARAVAKLRHANIVTVYEAGSAGGVAFLAMELVQGKSLDERMTEARLTQRPLPLADLLRWTRDVARALAAAHAAGIVHRDVKPSNVRITPEGNALLLDFGLALDPDSATISRSGQVQGTLAYASPEQIGGGPERVDPRTDVWSLGVTLYEGLTGHRPFEGARVEELLHEVLTREPVAPRALVASLPRDVETVVLKALEKERARRYDAAELADELDALLEGRPVRAHPTGPLTRAWKWSRRRPAHASSAALAALLVVGGPLVLAFVQTRHARALATERDAAEAARQLAEARAVDLEDLALFQGESIGALQPPRMAEHLVAALHEEARSAWTAAGQAPEDVEDRLATLDELLTGINTTDVAVSLVRTELLEPTIAMARERFAKRPKVQGMLLHTIAATCWSLGLEDLALETQQASYDVLAAYTPSDDRDRLVSAASLGQMLMSTGHLDEAEPLVRDAAAGLARLHGIDDSRTLSARHNLALLLRPLGKLDEATAVLRDVLASRRRVLGDDDPDTLYSMSALGGLLFVAKDFAAAEPLMTEAYERRRATLGDGDQATLASANNLATLYRELGRFDDAERVFAEALAAARKSLGHQHPTTRQLGASLVALLLSNEHPAATEGLLRDALAFQRETAGALHADTLATEARLGDMLRQLGRLDEAEALLGEAYVEAGDALGATAAAVRPVALAFAELLCDKGEPEEALAIVRSIAPLVRAASSVDDGNAQRWLACEVRALTATERFAESAAVLASARPARPAAALTNAVDALFAAWPASDPARAATLARWHTNEE